MNIYEVKKIIKYNKEMSFAEYLKAIKNTYTHYCNGISELRDYCGGHLHYSHNAKCYMGINNGYEYVARKVG